MRLAALLGLALCAGHAAAFFALTADPPPPFEVHLLAPSAASPTLATSATSATSAAAPSIPAHLDPALAARVRTLADRAPTSSGAGLRRLRWRADYRGGYVRSVGASQLVGPFQDPAAPPCAGRVVISQRLLDDGAERADDDDAPTTIAALARHILEEQLADQGRFPVGEFVAIRRLSLTLAELSAHPDDRGMLRSARPPLPAPVEPGPSTGYLRLTATLSFERVDVPIVVALIPRVAGQRITMHVAARARLAFDNRVAQWLSDFTNAHRLADLLARRQLDQLVLSAIEPPPPLPLPGGGELRFVPCADPQIRAGASLALPFAVALSGAAPAAMAADSAAAAPILPPLFPAGPTPPPGDALVALELDVNALNGLLHGAWASGLLDRQLAAAGLDARFNGDPTVETYLSLRVSPPRLALPPVLAVAADGQGLQLSTEATVQLRDGATTTLGHLWTSMRLTAAPPALRASLHQLELTCEPRPRVLAPCYSDIVAAMTARTGELDTALTSTLSAILTGLFADRILGGPFGEAELPAELLIQSATPSLAVSGGPDPSATIRLDLAVQLRQRTP